MPTPIHPNLPWLVYSARLHTLDISGHFDQLGVFTFRVLIEKVKERDVCTENQICCYRDCDVDIVFGTSAKIRIPTEAQKAKKNKTLQKSWFNNNTI